MDSLFSVAGEHKWGLTAFTIVFLLFMQIVVGFLKIYLWRPEAIRKAMQEQGVSGPKPKFMTGNLEEIEAMRSVEWAKPMCKPGEVDHNYVAHLFPHYKLWKEEYGKKFLMWWGEEPAILETELNLIFECFGSKYDGSYEKQSRWEKTLAQVIGQGLAIVNGITWARRRRMVQPAFHPEKLKELVWPMITATRSLVDRWDEEALKAGGGEWTQNVDQDMFKVAADVLARAAFHSSYKSTQGAFEKQLENLRITFSSIAWSFIPFYNYIPIPKNIRRWQLHFQIESTLKGLINTTVKAAEADLATGSFIPKDLVGLLVSSNKDPDNVKGGLSLSEKHLMDEMKTFFSAGFDTISSILTWSMLCLGDKPIWQERVYEEMQELFGDIGGADLELNAEKAGKLKTLTMVINEAIRLYPPAPQLARTARKDVQLGSIHLPKGLSVFICLPMVHRLPEIWGEDANEFKPERFKDGVSKACTNPMAYMPFSYGPRSCVAKNFAMLELKVVLAMIIQKFKFTLSPTYLHNPIMEGVVLKAGQGVPLLVRKRE